MMPKVAPFFLLLLLVYFLCLNTAKVVHLFAYQKEWNAYSLSFAFSFTHYIYTHGRALCLAVSVLIKHYHTTLCTTRTREVAFGASWTLLSSLSSPRENLKFMEERADGSEFSILRGCVILECLGGFLFPSPREN